MCWSPMLARYSSELPVCLHQGCFPRYINVQTKTTKLCVAKLVPKLSMGMTIPHFVEIWNLHTVLQNWYTKDNLSQGIQALLGVTKFVYLAKRTSCFIWSIASYAEDQQRETKGLLKNCLVLLRDPKHYQHRYMQHSVIFKATSE